MGDRSRCGNDGGIFCMGMWWEKQVKSLIYNAHGVSIIGLIWIDGVWLYCYGYVYVGYRVMYIVLLLLVYWDMLLLVYISYIPYTSYMGVVYCRLFVGLLLVGFLFVLGWLGFYGWDRSCLFWLFCIVFWKFFKILEKLGFCFCFWLFLVEKWGFCCIFSCG